jgi:hypothetical protein
VPWNFQRVHVIFIFYLHFGYKTKHDCQRDYKNHRLNMITVSRYMDNRCIPVVLSFGMEYCVLDVGRLQCVDDGVDVASHRSKGGVNSPLDRRRASLGLQWPLQLAMR